MIRETGALVLFGFKTFKLFLLGRWQGRQFIEQMFHIGVKSLPITMVAGLFVGAIMAIQINVQLRDFGAQAFLGGLATSTTLRNVGPVLIAFMLAGKVGAYTSAELGSMRVSDQIDAMACLGLDPMEYLIVPRCLAVVATSTLLLVVGLVMTVLGGAFVANTLLDVNFLQYTQNIPKFVTVSSMVMGVVKSFVFGVLMGVLCCYRGYTTTGGAEGVGNTVRKTSVLSLLFILIADFLLSGLASGIGG